MHALRMLVAAAACLGGAAAPAAAQVGDERLTITVVAPDAPVPAGGAGEVRVRFALEPGWHVYASTEAEAPTRVVPDQPGGIFRFGTPRFPESHRFDVGGGLVAQVHEGTFDVVVPFTTDPATPTGPQQLSFRLSYQICNDQVCLDPVTDRPVAASVPIGPPVPGATPAPPPATATPPGPSPPATPAPSEDLTSGGFLVFLLTCVVGGAISLIMPCVYPLIPVTVTFFLKQGAEHPGRGLGLGLAYGAGIVVSFTVIGTALSSIVGASGAQEFAANPWVNLVVAAIFAYLALALFGAVPLDLPSFVRERAVGAPRKGYGGAFVLGLVFTVVTFSCVIPIAGGLLFLAASGRPVWAATGMVVYSSTMALPFVAMGAFPRLLKEIPKGGGWMHTVKVTTGFLELALASYYLTKSDFSFGWGLFSHNMIFAIWIGTSFFAATYLLGMWRLPGDEKVEHIGLPRMFVALAFAGLGLYLLGGLAGRDVGLFGALLPPEEGAAAEGGIRLREHGDYEAARAEALATQRPLFVEFTGNS